ncbi:MAG: asparaginase [Candidatus Eremiobacteraeota bacterium]|nr:asparaginase [Candidatus Eremiobacteraeota bacterium]
MTHELKPFDCGDQALVLVTRGTLVESQHCVCYAVLDIDGHLRASHGDIDRLVYMRSAAKPLIATAVVSSGAADRFGFSDEEIALTAASHSGEPRHVATAQKILQKIGLDESALRCGVHAPTHGPSADALCEAGELPRAIHNNCSGKHAGILALAVHRGLSPEGYLAADHRAEVEILDVCAQLLDMPLGRMAVAVDGCGIPVIAVPLRTAAHFFARLADPERFPRQLVAALQRVVRAMIEHPYFVAGTNRFDTDLMTAARPNILAKGGAEGYHASAALKKGLGMTIKVADGNYRAVAPLALDCMQRLSVVDDAVVAALQHYRTPSVRNLAGTVVGEIRVAAPAMK